MCRCSNPIRLFMELRQYMITHPYVLEQRQHMMCVFVSGLQIHLAFAELKMTLEWPISSRHLGHLYLSVFCKGQQIGTSLRYNVPLWLGHNSVPGLGHRGAQSLALQEESGPKPFPGGLVADSDVVPTVRCQQERGVRLSAWVWDVVCVKGREKTESLCVRVYGCVCVCMCVLMCPF